jgi:hypothetical protein
VLLFAGAKVHADPIPIYEYTTEADPQAVTPQTPNSGLLTFLVQSSPADISLAKSNFIAAQLSAGTLTGDNYVHSGYVLTVNITDLASKGPTQSVQVSGEFNGQFLPGGSQVVNTLFDDNNNPITNGTVTRTLTFDSGNVYTIDIDALANVGKQGTLPAAINGVITVAGPDGGPPIIGGGGPPPDSGPSSTPEPSTMLLSCLGLSFLGASAWRKRRTKVAADL